MKPPSRIIPVIRSYGDLLANPKDAERLRDEILKKFQEGHKKTVVVNLRNVKVLLPRFIEVAFCDFGFFQANGITPDQVLRLKFSYIDEHMRYLITKSQEEARKKFLVTD